MGAGTVHAPQRLGRLLGAEPRLVGEHHLGQADDGVERRAQLVAHVGEELRLVLARELELAALFLDLGEQVGILDRQHRLRPEGLQQVDRGFWELAGLPPAHDQRADDPVGAEQGDDQQRAEAGLQKNVVHGRRRLGLQVGNLHRLALRCRLCERAFLQADAMVPQLGDQVLAHAVGCAQLELAGFRIGDVDRPGRGAGERNRLGDDGGEDGLQVEGGVHRLAHLAERAQLAHRLIELAGAQLQLAGALFHLAFQPRIELLQAASHLVELAGKSFQLVAGLDGDALTQVAAADAGRAGAEHPDRSDHATRQEHAGEHGEDQRRQQDHGQALERGPERRIGLLERQLDEHLPAERRHRGGCRQHAPPVDVVGLLDLLCGLPGRAAARGAHLLEARHVGIAQDQADVRMRDQPALRIHHIGMATLADLDLRDHVPDQLEVHLGDADPGVAPRPGDRQRHVGLRLAAEIDRAVVDLVGHRLSEFRVLRKVGSASDHIHGEARDPQALLAGGVELGQLGDRRHLAQQTQRIEPPLVDRAGRPRQLGGPAELALDLLDELADLRRRRLGLLALDADKGDLVLVVIEVDVEGAARRQRQEHHGDEQGDVLDEQAVADPAARRARHHGVARRAIGGRHVVGRYLQGRHQSHVPHPRVASSAFFVASCDDAPFLIR